MTAPRRHVTLWTCLALVACTGAGSEGSKTVDSADGELDVPRRKAPPYQVAPVASSGSITGTVTLPAPAAAPASGPCAGKAPASSGVVVYLEDIARGRAPAADRPRRYALEAEDCTLSPAVSIVAAGGTLNVSNGLRAVHHVAFTYEGMKTPLVSVPFSDPGQLVPSEKVLAVPGLVDVRSDLDPALRARLVVVEHPYAVQATNGKFLLDSVPPGTYTLVAVGATGRAETKVEVRAGAATPVALQLQ